MAVTIRRRPLGATILAAIALTACSGSQLGTAYPPSATAMRANVPAPRATSLSELDNLDYSDGSITVFRVQGGIAHEYHRFIPSSSGAQGIAADGDGLIYTTITAANGKPCSACVAVYTPQGGLVARLPAPILTGAPGEPALTDVALDAARNIYVSDYGQQAVYFFPPVRSGKSAPAVVVQKSQNAASVLSTPSGADVVISGGCGFGAVRPYARAGGGQYQPGSCFGIGTVALIGGASDDAIDILTPVDGVPGLVSVSSPTGGTTFHTPDQRFASISGVALTDDASVAYVADHHKESVYAFARPANGWLTGGQPKLLATYKGFKNLDIIAVRP